MLRDIIPLKATPQSLTGIVLTASSCPVENRTSLFGTDGRFKTTDDRRYCRIMLINCHDFVGNKPVAVDLGVSLTLTASTLHHVAGFSPLSLALKAWEFRMNGPESGYLNL